MLLKGGKVQDDTDTYEDSKNASDLYIHNYSVHNHHMDN